MKILLTIEVEVTGTYTKGDPGLRTYPNGDPGYPPDSPSFDVEKVEYNGVDITKALTYQDFDAIVESAMNDPYDFDY